MLMLLGKTTFILEPYGGNFREAAYGAYGVLIIKQNTCSLAPQVLGTLSSRDVTSST